MTNRLIVDIYWCALSATWCCKTFTIVHAQNIVIQKMYVRAEGDAAASSASPLDLTLAGKANLRPQTPKCINYQQVFPADMNNICFL